MSAVKLLEIYADTRGQAVCRGCGAPIEWAEIVASGKKMCFDGRIVALKTRHDEGTQRRIEAVDFATNHWATCSDAKRFKRKA